MKPATHILGIDIAKLKFDVNLRPLQSPDGRLAGTFNNDPQGFKALMKWLAKHSHRRVATDCQSAPSPSGRGVVRPGPKKKTSGTSVDGPARLSRMGSRRGRRALYMPALSTMRCNPIIQELVERLRQRGRGGKYIVVAVMRKLLRLIYGVIKQAQPFDQHWMGRTSAGTPAQGLLTA